MFGIMNVALQCAHVRAYTGAITYCNHKIGQYFKNKSRYQYVRWYSFTVL